jgi:hypothetical protein
MRRVAATVSVGLLLAAFPAAAAKPRIVSVPDWRRFDGVRWGELVLDETTRAAFEQRYAFRRTDRDGVLQATTSNRSKTQLFLVFDGPGEDARLAWIVCFYDGGSGAPRRGELAGRYEAREITGYPTIQRAGWRLFAATAQGVAAVDERDAQGSRVAALIMGRPGRATALVRRTQAEDTSGQSPLGSTVQDRFTLSIGRIDVDVSVASAVRIDRGGLQRESQRAAEDQVRDWPIFQLAAGGDGRLAVGLEVEPRTLRDRQQVRIAVQATLDAEGVGGAVHARSDRNHRDLDAAGGQGRIEEEARWLVERGIDALAASAQKQLQQQRAQSLVEARGEARLALLDFLAREARSAHPSQDHDGTEACQIDA